IIIQKGEIKAEVNLNEIDEKTEKAVIEVQPAEKALEWLAANKFVAEVYGDAIAVNVSKQNIPQLNRSLIEQNFSVYAITPYTQSLEDEFIKATTAFQEEGEQNA
ncbi:ABC transporter ATP-binding protein, partial [Bacillus atrophaeus]|nr:ABC transporter ATP-binding protein [Bacillus atrophaeus]